VGLAPDPQRRAVDLAEGAERAQHVALGRHLRRHGRAARPAVCRQPPEVVLEPVGGGGRTDRGRRQRLGVGGLAQPRELPGPGGGRGGQHRPHVGLGVPARGVRPAAAEQHADDQQPHHRAQPAARRGCDVVVLEVGAKDRPPGSPSAASTSVASPACRAPLRATGRA
jgi:hypothetical protein